MGDIFNLDNKFFQTLGKGVDCVCLSLLWMICCIPLAFGIYVAYVSKAIILALPCIILAVPAGIATTALYYAVNKGSVTAEDTCGVLSGILLKQI